jgi:hypothetical protein
MKTKLSGLIGILLLAAQAPVFANAGMTAVSEQLLNQFRDAYPQAEKVQWNESGDHYFVHFKDHQVLSEIEYDHDGNFVGSIRFYSDESLVPTHLSWELHKRFRNKTVYGITETNTETETLYYVKLQDSKEWVTVKGTADGIVQIVERFNKQ